MLKSISLRMQNDSSLLLDTNGITVFVGPNNSGKSLILREIDQALTLHYFPQLHMIKDYDVNWPTETNFLALIESISAKQAYEMGSRRNIFRFLPNGEIESQGVEIEELKEGISHQWAKQWLNQYILRYGVIYLNAKNRFDLIRDMQSGDLSLPPPNLFGYLIQNDGVRSLVQCAVRDALGVNMYLDPHGGCYKLRLSDKYVDETMLNFRDTIHFFKKSKDIKDTGDGMQAFIGIVTAVLSHPYHTIIVDEPEAYLHPPNARRLGKFLGDLINKRKGSLLASTHSAEFLIGCIQSASSVNVVRLQYRDGVSQARAVNTDVLKTLLYHPLMRSANVVAALFYDGAVICESDNDRVFYSEIYLRILHEEPDLPSLIFLNTQNKQTICEVMGPLRVFGVPSAAIVDIDLIKDGKGAWASWVKAAGFDEDDMPKLDEHRQNIDNQFDAIGKRKSMNIGGVSLLPKKEQEYSAAFFNKLDKYGIFVVRDGALESWLTALNVAGTGTQWTKNMMDKLGSEPSDPSYVKPGSDDVWEFVRKLVNWVADPDRCGMS